MLVSSVGYFRPVSNGIESSKKHPIVNQGLNEQVLSIDKSEKFKDLFDSVKSVFRIKNSDYANSLDMIA